VIVCCGPISSGTRMLTKLVTKLCPNEQVVHHSMPQWIEFWDRSKFPEGTRYVVILRRPDISVRSAKHLGHGNIRKEAFKPLGHDLSEQELNQWWWQAIDKLAGLPDAYWMSYEALLADKHTQVRNLARWLGVTPPKNPPIDITDQDEKWRKEVRECFDG
jgi:hypothetical protein